MNVAVATAPEVGIPLGILIGLVTGGVAIFLFRTAFGSPDTKKVIQVVGEILALPLFWFGGPWLTTNMLASVEVDEIRNSYLLSLAVVFVPLAGIPLVRLSWATGQLFAAQETAPHPRSGDA